jgi:hypothetical protein
MATRSRATSSKWRSVASCSIEKPRRLDFRPHSNRLGAGQRDVMTPAYLRSGHDPPPAPPPRSRPKTTSGWHELGAVSEAALGRPRRDRLLHGGSRHVAWSDYLLGEGSLRSVIQAYLSHYHHERNHQGLANQLIVPESGMEIQYGSVVRRERLGGLLSYYHQKAAWLGVLFQLYGQRRQLHPSSVGLVHARKTKKYFFELKENGSYDSSSECAFGCA